MKLLIEIPEEEYIATKVMVQSHNIGSANDRVIANGIPLPEHHSDLIDKKEVYKKFYSRCLAKVATEVLNEVYTIVPATKEERKCTDCKWYGFTCECPAHCTQDTKIAWESATKEGAE